MRKALIGTLKVIVPLGLGVWLVLFFYRQLDEQQRDELFIAFGQANWWWLLFSLCVGWISHLSRAWRWRYLLGHMGYNVGYWNSYNAVMTGYFMNLLLPRAGEASRAVMLYRAEKVPFERGFGTILAERAVDLIMLFAITGVTLALQWDKRAMFQERLAAFRSGQGAAEVEDAGSSSMAWSIPVIGVLLILGVIYLLYSRPALRARANDAVRGFIAGIRSVVQTKDKGAYLFHTVVIWVCYVAMFWVGFYSLPTTAEVPMAGIMASFIAGAVGIVLVQGGIGVYPAFVALIVSMYMPAPEGGGLIRPDALAMGWLIWVAQTLMIIVLGGVSLLLISRNRKPSEP